ncbi:MAG: hypothetical protein AAGD34_22325 [Pseudomonadota bacterium]
MKRFVLSLAFVLGLSGAVVASEAVVIDGASVADGLKPGAVFAVDKSLTLQRGERLRVMLQSGALIDLEGPHQGPVSVTDASGRNVGEQVLAVAALIVGRQGRTSVLGASRESGPVALGALQPVWSVDANATVACVDGPLRLWRADPTSSVEVSARTSDARIGPVVWPEGEALLDLPMSVSSAGPMIVSINGATSRVDLATPPADVDPSDPGPLLAWFTAEGCAPQAERLLDRLQEQ